MTTTFLQVKNNASSTLAGTVDGTSDPVTFSVQAGEGGRFPSAFPFPVTIDDEILSCTARSSDSLTCSRAQQGTTIAAHTVGASVELRVTAKSVSDLNTAVNILEDGAALLAGRSGGQQLYGGTDSGNDLILESTSHATKGDVRIVGDEFRFEVPTSVSGNQVALQVADAQTITLNAGGGFRALRAAPTINVEGDPAGVSILTFNFGATVNLGNNAAYDLNGTRIFSNQPTYNLTSGVTYGDLGVGATNPMGVLYDGPTFTAASGGATATVTNYESVNFNPSVGTGWTFTNLRVVHARSPGGSGTIDTLATVDVEDYGSRATTPLSLRSLGAAVQMRHAGPGVFGANAAPTNSSVGLEVQSITKAFLLPRMTTTQRDALTAVDGMAIYNTTTSAVEARVAGTWTSL